MVVGILTRRDGYNIGTSLQAYAMQTIFNSLQIENKIINYCEYSKKARFRYFVLDLLGYFSSLFPNSKFYKGYKQRKKFKSFDNKLKLTDKVYYYTIDKNINQYFDVFVCGSDQIWNPKQVTKAFLLDFVDANKKKIAYAPSIGLKNDYHLFSNHMIKLINRFNYLSCRETEGCQYIESITHKQCQLVLDPTLLIPKTHWMTLEKEVTIPNKYVLCYFLGKNNYPIQFIERISKKFNLAIINIQMFYNTPCLIGENRSVSPEEFLYLVNHATIVCTNSYHGSIFSILYNKLFYLFSRTYTMQGYDESSRFDSLFETLNIPIPKLSIDNLEIPYERIEYKNINNRLDICRQNSYNYIKESLV